jgi:acyl-CoA synthetase (AMP-forming)/AMP-acid ligase II
MSTFYDLIFENQTEWTKSILITNTARYSIQDLHNRVKYYLSVFRKQGSIQGKKIGVLVPSIFEYKALLVAVNKEKGVFVPLSWQLRAEDLSKILSFIDPHMVISVDVHHGFHFGQVIQTWAEESQKETLLFIQDDLNSLDQPAVIPGVKRGLETENMDIIACTSGSTGTPKGIMLNVDSIKHWTESTVTAMELKSSDHVFSTIPPSAPFGICWLLTAFRYRFEMVMPEVFDLTLIVNLLKENQCNKAVSTPSLFKAMYKFLKSASPDVLHSLERCGFAGELANQDFVTLLSDMKGLLTSLYGLSEQGLLMYSTDLRNDPVEWMVGSHRIQYKITDLNSDGIGEISFHTPSGFSGYYKRPDLTDEVYAEDGWFATGDLVKQKENQKIEIAGRKKDLIKKAGQQVNPGEVEQVLLQHPRIKQAAVVGIPHSVFGEQVVAFVVAEGVWDVEELYSFAADRIARYKVPDLIKDIDQMPISQGKLDKVSLKKMAL